MTDRLELLRIDLETSFVLSGHGRIERINDPDESKGPRLCLIGSSAGNLVCVHHHLSDNLAARITALVAAAPPWVSRRSAFDCKKELVSLIAEDGPVESIETELIWRLPHATPFNSDAHILRSDTDRGRELLERLSREGVPKHLYEAGFVGIGDFWEPWCVALDDGQIAAIAFAARLSERGAAIGVYTFPGHRGRGYAAAVTAAWSSLASLEGRKLFYSARSTNKSSRRVTERLGLEHIGMKLEIA